MGFLTQMCGSGSGAGEFRARQTNRRTMSRLQGDRQVRNSYKVQDAKCASPTQRAAHKCSTSSFRSTTVDSTTGFLGLGTKAVPTVPVK